MKSPPGHQTLRIQVHQLTERQLRRGQRIELAIGRDLQFIRINGTLVGGLVGLVIHGLKQAIE